MDLEDSCFAQSRYYSQCRRSCPLGKGWDCEQDLQAEALEAEEPHAFQPVSISGSGSSGTPVALGLAGAGILLVSVAGAAYKYKTGRCHPRVSDASAAVGESGAATSSTNGHYGTGIAMAAITLDGTSQPPPPSSLPPV